MQWYHYVLIIIKTVFVIEFAIILVDKNKVDPKVYLITEILFKLLLSLYMEYLVMFTISKSIEFEDKIFISFGAGLLAYDAVINDLPRLLGMYGIHYSFLKE